MHEANVQADSELSIAPGASTAQRDPEPIVKPPLWITVLRNPLVRILLFGLVVGLIDFAFHRYWPQPALSENQQMALGVDRLLLRVVRGLIPWVVGYWVLVRLIERRPLHELRARRLLPDAAKGWLLGTAIMVSTAALMVAVGVMKIEVSPGPVHLLGTLLVMGLAPGIGEEIFARGVLYRVVEDGLGSWWALGISAIFFGAGHLSNPNSSVVAAAFIAIEAGLLLAMAYAWTRSLWFCMGLHAAWNFTQGGLLGIRVSGFEVPGLMRSTPRGAELLSGGSFGAEASLLTVILCTVLALWFARKAIADGRMVRPYWRRPRREWPASRAGVMEARAAGSQAAPRAAIAADAAV